MLRDKNLVPLSHQHQHALALCVRIERAPARSLPEFEAEIRSFWETEMCVHFAAEEQVLFPATQQFPELRMLVNELINEHKQIKELVFSIDQEHDAVRQFATRVAEHVRKEERQFFEQCQRLMNPEQIEAVGEQLNLVLTSGAGPQCALRPESNNNS